MMKSFQRQVGIIILLMLFTTAGWASGQDNATITVAGSNLVAPVLDALQTSSGLNISFNATINGTRAGFESLCQGQADVVNASRAISVDENKNCVNNNVNYTELLIAHNILAFVAPSDAAYGQCLSLANLNTIFPPSAQGKVTNWNQVAPENADTPLSVFIPSADLATYGALDQLIEGDGFRGDAVSAGSDTEVAALVSQTPGSIGMVTLPVAAAARETIKIIELKTNDTTGCAAPSPENVEQRLYGASNDLFIYVNRASLEKASLKDLLNYVTSDPSAAVISSLGLTPPTTAIYETNRKALAGEGSSHPFSEAATSFVIPADVAGQVTIAGSASGRDYLNQIKTGLTTLYTTLTVDLKNAGQTAGVRRLCNGEIDIALVSTPLTEEQNQNCAANNISTLPIELGKQAVILVANASSPQLACLTFDQLKATWNASASKVTTNWNQVDNSFPDQKITLFAPNPGSAYTDLLLIKVAGSDIPRRDDTENNNDPLYRAAAVANVEGALTYMSWGEYQQVLANNQKPIQLVGVNSGTGCVTPSLDTITDGSYPLSRSAQLLVNNASLTKVQVQSFLWYMASDENYSALEQNGFIGVTFGSLPALRETLQKAYVDAAVAASQAAEATPEATSEATAEATPDG